MIIDIHTHCFKDDLAARAVGSLAKTSGLSPFSDGTIDELKKNMKTSRVDLSVLQPIATKPGQTISINRWAADVCDKELMSFGTIHPDFADWKQEIKWLSDNGFKGVKFHPEYQDFFVDNENVFKLYDGIFNAGMIILFHAGNDLSYSEPFRCTPARLKRILDTFPGASIIAAHMGSYRLWDEVEEILVGRDIYFDTAFSLKELGKERSLRIIKEHSTKKVLLGSDSPWENPKSDIDFIKSLNLTAEEVTDILGGNAMRLLGL